MKTNAFQKTLAIFMSILLAMPLFILPTFAEDYAQLSVYTDSLNEGDFWYNCRALATATGTEVYRYNSTFYLSEDQDTIKIEYTVDETPTTELHTRSEDPQYFEYLRVMPAFGAALPTSPDGLQDGDYWFNVEGLVSFYSTYYSESTLDTMFRNATYYLSVDGTILRRTYTMYGYQSNSDELIVEEPGTMAAYLMQVGYDPNAGFSLLAKSADGLQGGDYWFDVASFVSMYGSEYASYYENADYYLSDDTNTIRVYLQGSSSPMEWTREGESVFFTFLKQVGVDSDQIEGFTLLPKSADNLETGDYWYDAAGFAAMANDDSYLRWKYYLSDDGNTLRIVMSGYSTDITKNSSAAVSYFIYLHKVGESYTLLPTSADGLEDGAYWFDAAGLAAATQEDSFLSATYSLRDDGEVLRVTSGEETQYYMNVAEYTLFFQYLRQAGVDPNAGFTALPISADGLDFGDWWFDAAGLGTASDMNEEELQAFLAGLECYLSDDGETLRLIQDGYVLDFPVHDEDSVETVTFLHRATNGFAFLPTSEEGLADGDYWFDATSFSALAGDTFTTAEYYLSEDGNVLRIMVGNQTVDVSRDDEEGSMLFGFLHQVGVNPNEGFVPLPTSPAGLNDGDYWMDAATLTIMESTNLLDAEYYLSEDGSTVRVIYYGMPNDFTAEDEGGDIVFACLHQIGADADTVCLTMNAPTEAVMAGNTVVVTVDLTQNPGIAGMSLSLLYDAEAMTLTDVESLGLFEAGNLVIGGDLTAVPFNILWDDAVNTENHTETGSVLKLTFTVKGSTPAGKTAVTMTYDAAGTFDVALEDAAMTIYGTSISITNRLPGDVNEDGTVDLKDVTALTRYLAGGWDVTVDESSSDVNADGILDLKDVVLIRRYLAGGWNVTLI